MNVCKPYSTAFAVLHKVLGPHLLLILAFQIQPENAIWPQDHLAQTD